MPSVLAALGVILSGNHRSFTMDLQPVQASMFDCYSYHFRLGQNLATVCSKLHVCAFSDQLTHRDEVHFQSRDVENIGQGHNRPITVGIYAENLHRADSLDFGLFPVCEINTLFQTWLHFFEETSVAAHMRRRAGINDPVNPFSISRIKNECVQLVMRLARIVL